LVSPLVTYSWVAPMSDEITGWWPTNSGCNSVAAALQHQNNEWKKCSEIRAQGLEVVREQQESTSSSGAASTCMTNAMHPLIPARRALMTFLVHTAWCTFSGLGVKRKERAPVLAVLWWPWMMCSPYQRCVVGPKWCVLHPITGLYMSTVGDRICACKRKHALLITQTVGLAASHEMLQMLQTFSAYSGRLSIHSTMEASMFTSMVRKLAGFPSLSWGVNKGA